jgi:hypothetical protein
VCDHRANSTANATDLVAGAAALAPLEQGRAPGGDHRREGALPDGGLVPARTACTCVFIQNHVNLELGQCSGTTTCRADVQCKVHTNGQSEVVKATALTVTAVAVWGAVVRRAGRQPAAGTVGGRHCGDTGVVAAGRDPGRRLVGRLGLVRLGELAGASNGAH